MSGPTDRIPRYIRTYVYRVCFSAECYIGVHDETGVAARGDNHAELVGMSVKGQSAHNVGVGNVCQRTSDHNAAVVLPVHLIFFRLA